MITRKEPEGEIDRMAEFFTVWSRLGDDEKAVHLELLRGLVALPESESSDHLFAAADRELRVLRAKASCGQKRTQTDRPN